ncbi:MAG: hypothetical protein IT439_01800 [Phycisphaerales bacterium]|nr:hypothetical protein [Phycisphaerales bacterium]
MTSPWFERVLQASALAVIASAGVVFAQDHPGSPGDPGYNWGRDNCGPHTAGLRSAEECYECCNERYQEAFETPTWLDQCLGYCDSVNWEAWNNGGE